MANLRANRITSTEVFETTGSVQFDGSGDYLSLASSGDFELGNGSFTLEAFVYGNSWSTTNGGAGIIAKGNTSSLSGEVYTLQIPSGVPKLWVFNSSGTYATPVVDSGTTLNTNTWYHLAVTRDGNTTRIFIDGVLKATSTENYTINTGGSLYLGTQAYNPGQSDRSHNGHISNLRITKGTALYTENFTPPTRELEVIPNTVLLACQSTTKTDEEKTGKTITVNGDAVANELTPGLLTNVVKSGGSSAITGSVEFDGTGDYLSLADNANFELGSGDFTIEFYINSTQTHGSYYSAVSKWQSSNFSWMVRYSSIDIGTGWSFFWSTNGGSYSTIFGKAINDGAWHHIAVTRSGTTIRTFTDGVLNNSTTTSDTFYNGTANVVVGSDQGAQYFNGFISNLRIIKGTALYTSNFIPPTRNLTKLPGTVLLCCQDNESVTTEVTGKTITANGDPTPTRFTPSVGSDGSVEFAGPTTINTENYFYLPTGPTEQRGRGRGLFGGGDPGNVNTIAYINIQSTGNAIDFGDLTVSRLGAGGCSSSIRGIFGAGYNNPTSLNNNVIDYITISTTADAVDFGDLITARHELGACSNATRGVFGGGVGASPLTQTNVIEYLTIASTGNSQDFGDLTVARRNITTSQSPTRGIFFGGRVDPASVAQNIIDYITIASTGNAVDFGDLATTRARAESVSSTTRAVCVGGENPTAVTSMEYITIASTGNAVSFGTASSSANNANNGASNCIRGVFHSAYLSPAAVNTMEYITIAATGNSVDFGDLTYATTRTTAFSDSHGGLG